MTTFTKKNQVRIKKLQSEAKKELLNSIAKDWKLLLGLHFQAEGGISGSKIISWKPLSTVDYAHRKEEEGFGNNILQRSTAPRLATRWKQNVKVSLREGSVTMNYPKSRNDEFSGQIAMSHQAGLPNRVTKTGTPNPLPQRAIIIKDFKKIFINKTKEFFKK